MKKYYWNYIFTSCRGHEIIPIPAPYTMFSPHYRRYRGKTIEILPITADTAVLPR